MSAVFFAAVIGQALLFGDPWLLFYAGCVAVPVFAFVRWYEEPVLRRKFGADYEAYRAHVPAWWPRLHAYRP